MLNSSSQQVVEGSFSSIPVALYRPGETLDRDVHLLYQGQYILYRTQNYRWTKDDVEKLKSFGVQDIYLKQREGESIEDYLEKRVTRLLNSKSAAVDEKAQIIYMASKKTLYNLFENPTLPESLDRSVSCVKQCLDYLTKNRHGFYHLLGQAQTGFQEHLHAMHVATYSIGLARQMGYRTQSDAIAIGTGAILHDIGKAKIDSAILEKQGELTEEEWEEVKKHPQYGYDMVREHATTVPSLAQLIILQHHERPDGKGYPQGLTNDIHIFSKMVKIADSFDSLTSNRYHKEKMKPLDAMKLMLKGKKTEFDETLLIGFIKMLQEISS